MVGAGNEVLDGVWRFQARHPEWTEEEGGEEGWDPEVASWALRSPRGLVLIDPLVTEWTALDALVERHGRAAGIVRTCHWHQRSISQAAARYDAAVWASLGAPEDRDVPRPDHAVRERQKIVGGLLAMPVERADEIALWLPDQRALVCGDVMLRKRDGTLRMCPPSWIQPAGGRGRLRELLSAMAELPIEHVLVSHGPFVAGDGAVAMRAALDADHDDDAVR